MVLLDDPLSAVDPRVGRVLFSECIGPGSLMAGEPLPSAAQRRAGAQRRFAPAAPLRCRRIAAGVGATGAPAHCAAGATRVLVTHQRQYLPACDEVLVLRAGRIAHRGTYQELAEQGVPDVLGVEGAQSTRANHQCRWAPEEEERTATSGAVGQQ